MLTDRHFPYSSMQEINLDWILTKVKNILRFVPDDGAVGQILRRTAHGAEWSDEQGGGGAVTSVNGQTGDVILSIPTDTSDLNNDSGFVDAAGAAAAAPVQKVNGQTGIVTINKTAVGLGNVQNVLQYSASNPPPYPVTSVNTQTGDVVLSIPTDTSDLNNDSGFVDAAGAAAAAPVQSVNGQTGAVTVSAGITIVDTGTLNDDQGMTWNYIKYSSGRYEMFCISGLSTALVFREADQSVAGIHRRFETRQFVGKKIIYCTAQGQNSGRWIAACTPLYGTTDSIQFLQLGMQATVGNTSISAYVIAEDE